MKKDKIIIGIDPTSKEGDYKSMTVFKILKDKSIDIIESITTQDNEEFQKMKKTMKEKYLHINIIEETNGFSLVLPKKSRKTKDVKSFNSKKYEMFKDGYFNCDNVPYGYNFAIGMCLDSINFERKGKDK